MLTAALQLCFLVLTSCEELSAQVTQYRVYLCWLAGFRTGLVNGSLP